MNSEFNVTPGPVDVSWQLHQLPPEVFRMSYNHLQATMEVACLKHAVAPIPQNILSNDPVSPFLKVACFFRRHQFVS
jgi:hypothetical protein